MSLEFVEFTLRFALFFIVGTERRRKNCATLCRHRQECLQNESDIQTNKQYTHWIIEYTRGLDLKRMKQKQRTYD